MLRKLGGKKRGKTHDKLTLKFAYRVKAKDENRVGNVVPQVAGVGSSGGGNEGLDNSGPGAFRNADEVEEAGQI